MFTNSAALRENSALKHRKSWRTVHSMAIAMQVVLKVSKWIKDCLQSFFITKVVCQLRKSAEMQKYNTVCRLKSSSFSIHLSNNGDKYVNMQPLLHPQCLQQWTLGYASSLSAEGCEVAKLFTQKAACFHAEPGSKSFLFVCLNYVNNSVS